MSPEEADAALAKAIAEHAEAYGISGEYDMLGEYAIVASWFQPDIGAEEVWYTTAYHTPTVSPHVSRGLFALGLELATRP